MAPSEEREPVPSRPEPAASRMANVRRRLRLRRPHRSPQLFCVTMAVLSSSSTRCVEGLGNKKYAGEVVWDTETKIAKMERHDKDHADHERNVFVHTATSSSSSSDDSDAPSTSPTVGGYPPAPVTPAPSLPPSPNAAAIEALISEQLTDDGSLDVQGSPQDLALQRLLQTNPGLDPTDEDDVVDILQIYALNTVYYAMQGSNWTNNDHWTDGGSPCDGEAWYGVSCDGATSSIVERLSLSENNLLGRLPSEIAGLSSMATFNASSNQITGTIPIELGSFARLEELRMDNNFLSGELPAELGGLEALEFLSLSRNAISDEIPPELGLLTALTQLELQYNYLSGEIPPELGLLTALTRLELQYNDLSGEIPQEVQDLPNLEVFNTTGNSDLVGN